MDLLGWTTSRNGLCSALLRAQLRMVHLNHRGDFLLRNVRHAFHEYVHESALRSACQRQVCILVCHGLVCGTNHYADSRHTNCSALGLPRLMDHSSCAFHHRFIGHFAHQADGRSRRDLIYSFTTLSYSIDHQQINKRIPDDGASCALHHALHLKK